MSTTPTPVERAATALAERGPIDDVSAVDIAAAVLAAALDVEEIARVLAEHSDYGSSRSGWTCVCGAPLTATSTEVSDLFRAHQAAALIERLTGGGR